MTQPAPQPPVGPPQPSDPQGTPALPPPAAPPAAPAAVPYGTPPQAPPQQPLAPGAPPVAPPYAAPPTWPPAAPPAPVDDGSSGYDLSRLPRAAREEIERLRDQVQRSATELRGVQISQQAHGVAVQHGVNPDALLGSMAWQQAVAQLDPGAPDFGQRLAWTVQAVAQANPWMTQQPAPSVAPAAPTPPASGADFAGAGGGTQPISEAELAQMTPQQIDAAWRAGRLKHLM